MTRIVAFLSCNEFWNALSAIGSILASVTALWLARREHIKRIEAMLIWDAIEHYEPVLFLFNIGNVPIAIRTIQLSYQGREFFKNDALEDFKSDSYGKYIINPNSSKKIRLDENELRITGVRHPYLNKKVFVPRVTIRIRDIAGKKFTFRQKMTERKMGEAILGAAFFDNTKK